MYPEFFAQLGLFEATIQQEYFLGNKTFERSYFPNMDGYLRFVALSIGLRGIVSP